MTTKVNDLPENDLRRATDAAMAVAAAASGKSVSTRLPSGIWIDAERMHAQTALQDGLGIDAGDEAGQEAAMLQAAIAEAQKEIHSSQLPVESPEHMAQRIMDRLSSRFPRVSSSVYQQIQNSVSGFISQANALNAAGHKLLLQEHLDNPPSLATGYLSRSQDTSHLTLQTLSGTVGAHSLSRLVDMIGQPDNPEAALPFYHSAQTLAVTKFMVLPARAEDGMLAGLSHHDLQRLETTLLQRHLMLHRKDLDARLQAALGQDEHDQPIAFDARNPEHRKIRAETVDGFNKEFLEKINTPSKLADYLQHTMGMDAARLSDLAQTVSQSRSPEDLATLQQAFGAKDAAGLAQDFAEARRQKIAQRIAEAGTEAGIDRRYGMEDWINDKAAEIERSGQDGSALRGIASRSTAASDAIGALRADILQDMKTRLREQEADRSAQKVIEGTDFKPKDGKSSGRAA